MKRIISILAAVLLVGTFASRSINAAPSEVIDAFNKVHEVQTELKKFDKEIEVRLVTAEGTKRIDESFEFGMRYINDRTSVSIRDMINTINGAEVEWDDDNKLVIIKYGERELLYPLNKPIMYDGEKLVELDTQVAADTELERTFIPLRSIAETLGYTVDWNGDENIITLTEPGYAPPSEGDSSSDTILIVDKDADPAVSADNLKLDDKQTLPDMTTPIDKTVKLSPYNVPAMNDKPVQAVFDNTSYAFNIHKPFKLVTEVQRNEGFKLVGKNDDDARIGTYIYGPGEKTWNDEAKKTGLPIVDMSKLNVSLPKDAKLDMKSDEVKKFIEYINGIDDMYKPFIDENSIIYDGTGIFNLQVIGVTHSNLSGKAKSMTAVHPVMPDKENAWYMTTDYGVVRLDKTKRNDYTIDKVLIKLPAPANDKDASVYIIVDVPDIMVKNISYIPDEHDYLIFCGKEKCFLTIQK